MQKDESLQRQQQQDTFQQQKVQLAEVSVRLQQVKSVQPNLAVADGRIILTDEDLIGETNDRKHKVSSILGFVHNEPCSIFLRSRDTVQRLQGFMDGLLLPNRDKDISQKIDCVTEKCNTKTKGTGRWHSLAGETKQDTVVMRIQTVLTKVIERNRKGTKLIECHGIVDIGTLQTLGTSESNSTLPGVTPIERMGQAITPTDTAAVTAPMFQMYDKSQRQELFADWLVSVYGQEFLSQGSGVLDVAGGKGDLSRALQKRGIPSVVLDPDPRMSSASGEEMIPVIAVALEGDGSHLFQDSKRDSAEPDASTATNVTAHERHWIRTCSMIAAMHPDQATEPILKLARYLGNNSAIKPFALLPCCVMPSLFPDRVYQGQPVRSYKIFCQYLQSLYKDTEPTCEDNGGSSNLHKIQVDYLPFMGRNMILYTTPDAVVEATCISKS